VLNELTLSATTVPVGNTVTLDAKTNCDIRPTPYYLQIFDATTGTLLGSTGAGADVSVNVSQNVATTHGYIAYLDTSNSSTFPPAGINQQTAANYVTWEGPSENFRITLTGPQAVDVGAPPGTYTATITTSTPLIDTVYYIEIFDETTGAQLTKIHQCGGGTTCQVSFTPQSVNGDNLIAFVSGDSSTIPPMNTQASSNVLFTFLHQNIQ
jgi:hypothetical protein